MTTPEELYKLEQGVVESAVGSWRKDVEEVKKAILLLISEADSDDLTPLVPQIKGLISTLSVPANIEEAALAGILEAHKFGTEVVASALDTDVHEVRVSNNSRKAIEGLATGAQEALDTVRENLSRPLIGKGAQSVLAAVGPVLQSPAKIERAIVWSVNNASNSAVSKLSLEMGEVMTWISERDGCVHCLAYSGKRSTRTGFPKGLTFGKAPLESDGTLPHPPLHPNCRCTIEPGVTEDYAQALERESVRSVLRGFKLPSESEKVRIEATKKLLEQDPVAPESVKKYARRRVKNYEAEQEAKKDRK